MDLSSPRYYPFDIWGKLLEVLTATLAYTVDYAKKNNIPMRNKQKISYLLSRTISLMEDGRVVLGKSQGIDLHDCIKPDENLHSHHSDEDFTGLVNGMFLFRNCFGPQVLVNFMEKIGL